MDIPPTPAPLPQDTFRKLQRDKLLHNTHKDTQYERQVRTLFGVTVTQEAQETFSLGVMVCLVWAWGGHRVVAGRVRHGTEITFHPIRTNESDTN